jgi:hypothetical protein
MDKIKAKDADQTKDATQVLGGRKRVVDPQQPALAVTETITYNYAAVRQFPEMFGGISTN